MSGRDKRTNKERGLGWEHQQQRARLLGAHVEGTLCDLCGRPMYVAQGLDADHSLARSRGGTVADRLLHASCNRSAGAALRWEQQPKCRFHADCGSYHSRAW